MTDATPRLELPFLAAGQAQKEVVHNEALLTLDALVQPVVEEIGVNMPPDSPAAGQCWVVGDAPAGAWAGRPGAIAWWTTAGWRFAAVREGMFLWRRDHARWQTRNSFGWSDVFPSGGLSVDGRVVVGAQAGAIVPPAGGTTVDTAARNAINDILAALRGHGLIAS